MLRHACGYALANRGTDTRPCRPTLDSGSCRALTNRISATRAALLSAIAARGLLTAFQIRALPSKSELTATTDKFMSSNTLRLSFIMLTRKHG